MFFRIVHKTSPKISIEFAVSSDWASRSVSTSGSRLGTGMVTNAASRLSVIFVDRCDTRWCPLVDYEIDQCHIGGK